MNNEKVMIIKENRGIDLARGTIVNHSRLGEGIVIGFSSISGEPFVYFYDAYAIFGQCNACVSKKDITIIEYSQHDQQ